jgi:hypothetical protein
MTNFVDLWVYLSGSPLLWLTTTLIAYLAADAISAACGRHPLANPVLIAVTFVSIIVVATGTPFSGYFAGAQFVHFLLGPATVALAVPLVRYLPQVRRALVPMLVALVAEPPSLAPSGSPRHSGSIAPPFWHWRRNRPPRPSPWASRKRWAAIRR